MYAIIHSGGKQYPVSPGEEIRVERLEGDVGSSVEFDRILAVSKEDGTLLTGEDLSAAKVTGTISSQGRARKIIVYKFKRRKMYRRKQGHRQDFTQVKIGEILV